MPESTCTQRGICFQNEAFFFFSVTLTELLARLERPHQMLWLIQVGIHNVESDEEPAELKS